ncbi:MAG: hypothetical protein ACRC2J_18135, partial [Microcoleaceae cyanobacterium]
MRRILLLAVLFISVKSFGQPVGWVPRNSYEHIRGMYADSSLHIPTGCGAPLALSTKEWRGGAALYGDTCNNRLYLYSDTTWIRIARFDEVGGGGGSSLLFGRDDARNNTINDLYFSNAGKIFTIDSTGGFHVYTFDSGNESQIRSFGNLAAMQVIGNNGDVTANT